MDMTPPEPKISWETAGMLVLPDDHGRTGPPDARGYYLSDTALCRFYGTVVKLMKAGTDAEALAANEPRSYGISAFSRYQICPICVCVSLF